MKVLANKAAAKLICGLIASFMLLGFVPKYGIASDSTNTKIGYIEGSGGKGAAIVAEGESKVSALYSTFEGGDATGAIPAISLEDTTFGHFNNCIIRNIPLTGDVFSSLYTQTTDTVILIDNNFKGTIELDEPVSADSGPIKFYGFNSTTEGGIEVEDEDHRFGSIVNMHAYGDSAFFEDEATATVTVNGMPPDATVNVTYKNNAAIRSGDAVLAVKVAPGGSQFTVYRSATLTVTDDLEFFWTVEWEEEVGD